jgi:prepilin-type N-terminal cleavage/methylation domain-containing protein
VSRRPSALWRFLSCRTPGALRRLRDAGDDGFTLIELVIVLVILPLILGALAFALIVTFEDSTGVSTRIADSIDSQVTSAFYVRDVQSAQYVTTTPTPATPLPWRTSGPTRCGSGTTYVLGLAWASATGTQETVVSYWTKQLVKGKGTIAATGIVLSTTSLTQGSLTAGDLGEGIVQLGGSGVIAQGTSVKKVTRVSGSVTLSRSATPGAGVSFSIGPQLVRELCKGPGSGTRPSSVTTSRDFFSPFTTAVVSCVANVATPKCTTTTATPKTAGHRWVTTLGVTGVTLAVDEPAGKYNYNLTAAPRVANALGSPFGGCQGTGCYGQVPTLLALGGFQVITERAHAHITVIGTAVINHGWVTMSNGTTLDATGKIETTDTPPTDICHLTVTGTKEGKCAGTITPTPPAHITTPIADPFQGFSDPAPETTRPCPAGSATIQPGQYKCVLTISGTGETVTLAPGLYEFDTGVRLGGNGNLNATSDVLIYLPCNTAGPGHHQDTWATQCTESFSVTNGNLSAARMLTGPYAGLWFWQNEGDASPVTLRGHGKLDVVGILYASGAAVTLKGQATTTSVGSVIARTFSVTNSKIKVTG